MLSNQDWDQIIIGIGKCVVRCVCQLAVKWMDDRRTRTAADSPSIDTERLGSHTRHRREPHDD
jgi:hypothetical protein